MTNEVTLTVDPRRQMRINKIDIAPERVKDFLEVIERAYTEKEPTKEDLKEIRKFLIEYPQFCRAVFNMAESTRDRIINNYIGNDIAKIAIEEYTVNLRDDFGYHDAPIIEKLLIENIVTAWLYVQYFEFLVAAKLGGNTTFTQAEFWQKSLNMAQRRYLSACESLAKIRKMAIPALQLNIGDKQVNVAGNLQAGSPRGKVVNV